MFSVLIKELDNRAEIDNFRDLKECSTPNTSMINYGIFAKHHLHF